MYLAGKLSKFEVTDWVGRTPKQSRWWELYVEGISMDLLEGMFLNSFEKSFTFIVNCARH